MVGRAGGVKECDDRAPVASVPGLVQLSSSTADEEQLAQAAKVLAGQTVKAGGGVRPTIITRYFRQRPESDPTVDHSVDLSPDVIASRQSFRLNETRLQVQNKNKTRSLLQGPARDSSNGYFALAGSAASVSSSAPFISGCTRADRSR